MLTSITKRSYAKINLFLDVHGKIEHGYHEITTLFSEINLYDTITFHLTSNSDILIMSDVENLLGQNNLIYKVGIYIQSRYSVQRGALVELKKNIPIAAGLGGGSSNAAASINAFSDLWELNLSKEEKHEIARQFGSDINFFLEGYQAIGTGRGDVITPLEEITFIDNILLVNPNFAISAKEAYEAWSELQMTVTDDREFNSQHTTHNTQHLTINYQLSTINFFNALEPGISKKYPIIKEIIDKLHDMGAKKAMLSGSGPTIIAFYETKNECKKAQKYFLGQGFWTCITSTKRRIGK